MDPQTAIETAGEVSKAVTKFQEIVQKIFNPHWTKKQSDADTYADEQKLHTIRNNPDMDIMYAGNVMYARKRTPEALAYRAEQRALAESIRQEDNLEKILDVAANEISQMQSVSDKPVNEDWLVRLFHIAKDVSVEDMQYVWGKILAGEIERPGRFSYRTLECVRNLSQDEAQIFQRALSFSLKSEFGILIPYNESLLKKYGIAYTDLLRLDEVGLLQFKEGVGIITKAEKKPNIIIRDPYAITITSTDEKDHDFTMQMVKFSTIGNELSSIMQRELNKYYLIDFLKDIQSKPMCNNICIQLNQFVDDPLTATDCIDLLEENIKE